MDLRRVAAADHADLADFLDARTWMLRWLVAFFRRQDAFPAEEADFWSLWCDREPAGSVSCVVTHFFQTATTYVAATPERDLRAVEALCREELLPERLVGDAEVMRRWQESSPGFFARASRRAERDVLVFEGAGDVPPAFRPARPEELRTLEEYAGLYAAETGEELACDFESLIEAGLAFVVADGAQVKGYVRSNLSDGRYVHGGGVFVHAQYRGHGAGRALAQGLGAWVRRESGATAILDVDRKNVAAARAYERAGYKRHGGGLEARFPEGAWRG